MTQRRLLAVLLIFGGILLSGQGLWAQAQATTGVIEGTVIDQEGGVLPGVTVTLTNTGTNFQRVLGHGRAGSLPRSAAPIGRL